MVAISSPGSHRVMPDYVAVGASKAALESLTRYLAVELAPINISVNAVSPGYIDTDMTRTMREDVRSQIVAGIPAGRMGLPEDIANTIAFLASDDASYITGTNMAVNGGMHMYS